MYYSIEFMLLNNILQVLAVVGENIFFLNSREKTKSNTKKAFFAPKASKLTLIEYYTYFYQY